MTLFLDPRIQMQWRGEIGYKIFTIVSFSFSRKMKIILQQKIIFVLTNALKMWQALFYINFGKLFRRDNKFTHNGMIIKFYLWTMGLVLSWNYKINQQQELIGKKH